MYCFAWNWVIGALFFFCLQSRQTGNRRGGAAARRWESCCLVILTSKANNLLFLFENKICDVTLGFAALRHIRNAKHVRTCSYLLQKCIHSLHSHVFVVVLSWSWWPVCCRRGSGDGGADCSDHHWRPTGCVRWPQCAVPVPHREQWRTGKDGEPLQCTTKFITVWLVWKIFIRQTRNSLYTTRQFVHSQVV